MKQRGFTLVEMSIVLVIIGLVLGGIVGGQSLIRNARAQDIAVTVDDLRAAIASFKQRYNYLPGDFPAAAGDIINVAAPGGNGNGTIDGAIAATGLAALGSEVALAPWQLFNAGFISKIDNADPQRYIKTGFGAVHIASAATANGLVAGFTAANPAARNAILFQNVPCDVLVSVEIKIDDGNLIGGRAMMAAPACVGSAIVPWYAVAL